MKRSVVGQLRFVATFLGLSLVAAPLIAAPGVRTRVFDGKTLNGWTLVTCDAVVDDGQILLRAGNGLVQTERKYRDFALELEWKALKPEKWDSGIYFRYDSIPKTRPWPQRYQVNLRQGEEGNPVGLSCAQTKGLFKDRAWNKLKLTVRGSSVSLEVNGQLAWQTEGLQAAEGYIGLQAEVPGGGQHLFRNIFITEL